MVLLRFLCSSLNITDATELFLLSFVSFNLIFWSSVVPSSSTISGSWRAFSSPDVEKLTQKIFYIFLFTSKSISQIVKTFIFAESLLCVSERFSSWEKTLAETKIVNYFVAQTVDFSLFQNFKKFFFFEQNPTSISPWK